ncbi:MAG: ArnT family glycosyltransferase [Anaerolineae bacterium]
MRWVKGRWVGLAAFLGWLFAVLAVFYAVQKPLRLEEVRALLRALGEVALAAFTWAAAWAWGQRLLRWVAPTARLPRAYQHVASLALGLGGLALLILLLGLAGALRPALGWAVAALLAAPLGWDLAALLRQGGGPWLRLGSTVRIASPGEKAAALYMAAAFGGSLLLALAPPLGWDSLFYHLPEARWYLAEGGIQPLPLDVPHLHYPCLVEMLFLWSMLLGGERAAVLLHWGYGFLLTATVAGLARQPMGRRAAPWAVAMFGSMPMVFALASWAYTDLALATYLALGLWGVLLWREKGDRAYLVLGGASTGLALGVKYTAAPGALGLFVLVCLWAWQRPRRLREVLSFTAAAFLAAVPCYLKAWAFTGNPVYPFLFGGARWDAWRAQWYAEAGTGIGGNLGELLALPLTVTLGIRDVNYYDGRMGPLFLGFLPILVWAVLRARPRPQALWGCLLVAGVQALAWTAGVVWSRALFQSRLLLPALAMLAPAYGWALARVPSPPHPREFSLRRFLRIVVGLVLLLNLTEQALDLVARRPVAVLTGQEAEEAYLLRNLGGYYAAMQALEETPPGARVLFLWEPRSYYSPRPCQPDAILDLWPRLVLAQKEPQAIAAALQGQGWTHILWHEEGAAFVRRSGRTAGMEGVWSAWEGLQACCLRPVWQAEDGSYALYALR